MMEGTDLHNCSSGEKSMSTSSVGEADDIEIRTRSSNSSCKLICEEEEEDEAENDTEEEELAVLPRHTKVIVTGNNRTKSVLVGLHGVVKKAVGLGGWHWLVLTNGLEVKLQRNALSVLEPPTGLEEDDDDGSDHFSSRSNTGTEELGKSFRHKVRLPKPNVPLRGGGNRNQSKEKVDFNKLEMESLHRYWRHFHLCELGPNPSKEQLVNAVARHFMSQRLDETQVITNFMQAAKRLKTVCG